MIYIVLYACPVSIGFVNKTLSSNLEDIDFVTEMLICRKKKEPRLRYLNFLAC